MMIVTIAIMTVMMLILAMVVMVVMIMGGGGCGSGDSFRLLTQVHPRRRSLPWRGAGSPSSLHFT